MLDIMSPAFVTVEGRRIAYAEVSPSRTKGTILLLPGLADPGLMWYKQLGQFGQEYRTIALNPRDTGDSDPVTSSYCIADLADDAAAVLRALGIAKSHTVGFSMGGMVALEFALRHPELLDRLVLVSTSAGGLGQAWPSPRVLPAFIPHSKMEPGEQARKVFSRLMAPGYPEGHPEEMEQVARLGRRQRVTKEAYYRQVRAILRHDVSKRLARIEAPTLVIHGEKDPAQLVKNGLNLARKIPGAHLIRYPNTGHIVIIERAEEFNRDVLDFLAQD